MSWATARLARLRLSANMGEDSVGVVVVAHAGICALSFIVTVGVRLIVFRVQALVKVHMALRNH